MAMFVLTDATGLGTATLDSNGAFVDLVAIANETGIGLNPEASGRRQVTYTRALTGPPQMRLDTLVNTTFTPDYGAGPQNVDIVVVSLSGNLVLADGTIISTSNNGTALAPTGSGRAGSASNPTANCLVLYDTAMTVCVARAGTGGDLDLPMPGPVLLYHELSHAFRIVQDTLLALTGICDPSAPEENAAIVDENDVRTQIAGLLGLPVALRDPGIHCGQICPDPGNCCIVATLASGSSKSSHVQRLREVRDRFLRRTEVGYAFFDQLHYDYYGFSPQVVTLMAGDPELHRVVLRGYVEPLLEIWEFMVARSVSPGLSDGKLGQLFVDHLPPAQMRRERLEWFRQIEPTWADDEPAGGVVPGELLSLLRERAWPHESVQWALVRSLLVYHEGLTMVIDGHDVDAVGRRLRSLIDDWTADFPIAGFWGELTADQVAAELAVCDEYLLQTDVARERFRQRLVERFAACTAIQALEPA
jgi:hypothetical protein